MPQNATDIKDRLRTIAALVSPKTTAYVNIDSRDFFCVSVNPAGDILANGQKYWHGPDLTDLLEKAEVWASTQATVQRDAAVRRMALDLIDLKDQHGEITERLLLARKWTVSEIIDLHGLACERAGEMAAGAPFVVVFAEQVQA